MPSWRERIKSCVFESFTCPAHERVLLLPSGATPQRRDFVYPRQLAKSRSRCELLESLKRQQEELQAAMEEDEPEEEEEDKLSQVDHVRSLLLLPPGGSERHSSLTCVCSLMTASTLLVPPVHTTSFNMLKCFY